MTEPDPGPVLELALALAADLRDLAVDLADGGCTRTNLALLDRNLRRSVPSALGATVTLDRGPGHTLIRVHLVPRTLQPDEIHAALQVPLQAPDPTFTAAITFYAGRAVAFVDLATDLADTLGVQVDQRLALPGSPVEPGTSGLTDLTLVNIALGHLLNRGRTLAQARTELARLADHDATDLAGAAHLLLSSNCH